MIDPPHVVVGVQRIPSARFVGVNDRTHWHALADGRNGVAFLAEDEGKRAALALTHDDDDLPLAGLFFSEPPIDRACRPRSAGLIAPPKYAPSISFSPAPSRSPLACSALDQLAQFVREDEGGFVLAIEFAAQLKRAMALRPVGEDRYRESNREAGACGRRRSFPT